MRSYSTLSVRELLDGFASAAPAPGGGSAAALARTIGVSLRLMTVGVGRARSKGAAESRDLVEAADRLQSLQPALTALVDCDADAYSAVIEARRLPVGDEQSRIRQQAAVSSAMRLAT